LYTLLISAINWGFSVTVIVFTRELQPFTITCKVKVFVESSVTSLVVAPLLHKFPFIELDLKVTELPKQKGLLPDKILMLGKAGVEVTFTETELAFEHPLELVPITL
jgi:hypothetical protein